MTDTVQVKLNKSYKKIFDATTNAGESYTIQNTTSIPIHYFARDTTPDDSDEDGFILYAHKSGAIEDISDDIYFKASQAIGATLTYDLRETSV